MLLNSFNTLSILTVIGVLYLIYSVGAERLSIQARTRISNTALLLISYIFFLTSAPVGALILFTVSIVAYIGGRLLAKGNSKNRQRLLIWILVSLATLPLVIFKYSTFIITSINDLLNIIDVYPAEGRGINIIVPLGISFFTFQSLGYLFDVYNKKIQPETDLLDFLLFVAFFPQIASGPISRADKLLPQIKSDRPFSYDNVVAGFKLMLWGFFLKTVLADQLSLYVNPVFSNYTAFSGITLFKASICYSFQIYGDFAGYSLLAIGVGRIFGFKLPTNFNRPYLSTSINEFWRRWHISLSSWLRDYIYIPLGGSRSGKLNTYRNILVTFLVSGIWHGANWTFIIWGIIHGVIQGIEKFFNLGITPQKKILCLLRILITFVIINFAWIYFRSPSIKDGTIFIKRILSNASGVSLEIGNSQLAIISFALTIFMIKEIGDEYFPNITSLSNKNIIIRWIIYISLLTSILLLGILDSGQFIYVNF